MAVHFRNVTFGPLRELNILAPDGAVIGIIGEHGCGQSELLRLAAGLDQPLSGAVESMGDRRYVAMGGPLSLEAVNLLALDHAFAGADAFVRARLA